MNYYILFIRSTDTCACVLSRSVVSDSLWPFGQQPARFLSPWDSPGKNNGVGCHALLQGIFPTQGLNLGLLHCRWILYHLSHQGSQEKLHIYNLWVLLIFVVVLVTKSCLTPLQPHKQWRSLQAPLLSMGFPRQEYWSALSFSPPRDLPNPGIKSTSPTLAGSLYHWATRNTLFTYCSIN